MSKIYAYIDEAANLADENQFFIIGVVSTQSKKELKQILKRARKVTLGRGKRQIPEIKSSRVARREKLRLKFGSRGRKLFFRLKTPVTVFLKANRIKSLLSSSERVMLPANSGRVRDWDSIFPRVLLRPWVVSYGLKVRKTRVRLSILVCRFPAVDDLIIS